MFGMLTYFKFWTNSEGRLEGLRCIPEQAGKRGGAVEPESLQPLSALSFAPSPEAAFLRGMLKALGREAKGRGEP